MSFKDVGAAFMASCLSYFNKNNNKLTVLVATSGDTGGAVARGFLGIKGIEVVILYPCLLYTSPSPRDRTRSRMPSSA